MSVAFEKNEQRYPDRPGSPHAFVVNFVLDDRFGRVVDQARLDLAPAEPTQIRRFDGLLDLNSIVATIGSAMQAVMLSRYSFCAPG